MKTLLGALALFFCLGNLFAFDPVTPPPKKTLEWTLNMVSAVIWPDFECDDVSLLAEVVEHLSLRDAVPLKEYRWEIDASQLHLPHDWTFTFHGKGVPVWKVLAAFAEKCDADLLIQPGVIVLVPRKKG